MLDIDFFPQYEKKQNQTLNIPNLTELFLTKISKIKVRETIL